MSIVEANHSHRRVGVRRPTTVATGNSLSSVTTLASMWQRIPGDVATKIRATTPQNFAVLELPNENILRSVGVSAKCVGTRDHPYAKWRTVTFDSATTTAQALTIIETMNASNLQAIKFKLNFVNSLQVVFSRRDATAPASLVCTGFYEPSGAFLDRTQPRAQHEREVLHRKLEFVADDRGHITRPSSAARSRPVSPFAEERLYATCPHPEPSKLAFAFTPMSSISFLVRPSTTIPGCRPGLNKTNPNAIHFRPRTYNRLPRENIKNRYAIEVVEQIAGSQNPIDGRNSLSPLRSATGRRSVSSSH